MTAHAIKRFKLAATVALSFGLGMARVLPVQAAAIITPTNPWQSQSQPLDGYQFKLDDLALPAAVKTQARVAQTQSEPLSWSAETPIPKTSQIARGDAAKGQGAIFSEGFFSLVFFATVVYILYNLISSGKSTAAVSPPSPATEPSPPAAIADPETIAPPALDEPKIDEPTPVPTPVPTPALLPGLLGLSLKLFRQKKAESRTAAL